MYADEQKKKNMLAKLLRRGKIGNSYTPKENIYSGIPVEERGNLETLLDQLHRDGLTEYHKGKQCVSLNRRNKEGIRELLEGEVPDYFWDNF